MVRIVCTTDLFEFTLAKILKLSSKHLMCNYSHPVHNLQNQKFEKKTFSKWQFFIMPVYGKICILALYSRLPKIRTTWEQKLCGF